MKILVTGSSGHLGEALVRTLRDQHEVTGLDVKSSEFTTVLGSITDRSLVASCLAGADVVFHTATLHKPHVVTHSMQDFVDTNVSGTLTLLEQSVQAGIGAFVLTSTTSVFGHALKPRLDSPAVWVTEDLAPKPKNIYGVTKVAAEGLCELVHQQHGLPCIVLRTSRFFPEEDDQAAARQAFSNANLKVNELVYRRADIFDMVQAHLCAMARAKDIGFDRFIVSATSPFEAGDLVRLRQDAASVLAEKFPAYRAVYKKLGWQFFSDIDRVYVNNKARKKLGWVPEFDFERVLNQLAEGQAPGSNLGREVGAKGYHDQVFEEGPYPV